MENRKWKIQSVIYANTAYRLLLSAFCFLPSAFCVTVRGRGYRVEVSMIHEHATLEAPS